VGHRLLLSGWLRPFTAGDGWLCPIRAQVGRPRRHRCHQRPLAGWPDRRRVPAVHCRIEPFFISRRRAARAAGRRLRSASALEGPAGARRPHRSALADQQGSTACARSAAVPSSSTLDCPAYGRSVKGAPCGRVASDWLRLPWTRRLLARGWRLSRKTEQAGEVDG